VIYIDSDGDTVETEGDAAYARYTTTSDPSQFIDIDIDITTIWQ